MYELMCEVPCFVLSLFALLLNSADGMIAGTAGKLVADLLFFWAPAYVV